MLTTLYVARHAHRMNHTLLGAGTSDVPRDYPLTARGQEQLAELRAWYERLPASERPQAIVSSPYTRCLRTAEPAADAYDLPIFVEPGLAEWYAPVHPPTSGRHPSPRTAHGVRDVSARVSEAWTPLLYPDPEGESIPAVHARMYELLRRIEARCAEHGWERVLLVSHAAAIIALGRMMQAGGDYERACALSVRAGTASVSKYTRVGDGSWHQDYNGCTSFLRFGEERPWDFTYVPDNTSEPGMGAAWRDVHAPADPSLVFKAHM